MPVFSYQAINERGENISGTIEAETVETASNLLSSQGLIPSKVRKSGEMFGLGATLSLKEKTTRVKTSDLLLFTKQFRTMLKVGIPIVRIIQVLEKHSENIKIKKICAQMARDISGGSRVHESFRKFPKVFDELYCSMVQAGETSDSLDQVFERLVKIIEHEYKVKSDIKLSLQYPAFVSVALVVSFFVLLTYVIPKYLVIFKSHKIDLPLATRISDMIYQFLMQHGTSLLVFVLLLVLGLIIYFKTQQGQYVRDSLLLKIPIIGDILKKANISRFANIFEILQSSGVHVIESMNILSGTIGNKAITKDFENVRYKLEEGRGIAPPLEDSKHFTPLVTSMIAIGEESGSLNQMLREVTAHYDDEVEYSVKRLTEAIAPVLTIGLAVIIGFFALSIFVPMADLTRILK
ncbi:type II secretory pathway, component PulF [Candidatus Magnetomorum sp. HK-1]|nr:type II secretory pathway, component PulF [Candidatus Magnetomorum sp. HK-1]